MNHPAHIMPRLTRETLRIVAADLDAWAAVSGDHNPIHFDASQAQAIGIERPFAHGMLVLHPIKSRMTPLLFSVQDTGWACMDFRFRLPVFLDELLTLDLMPNQKALSLTLTDGAKNLLIIGQIMHGNPHSPAGALAQRTACVGADDIALAQRALAGRHLFAAPRIWVQLETLAFRRFLSAVDTIDFASGILAMLDMPEVSPPTTAHVVQTRNTVFVNTAAVARGVTLETCETSFRVADRKITQNACFGRVDLEVTQAEELLLRSGLNFTIRFVTLKDIACTGRSQT